MGRGEAIIEKKLEGAEGTPPLPPCLPASTPLYSCIPFHLGLKKTKRENLQQPVKLFVASKGIGTFYIFTFVSLTVNKIYNRQYFGLYGFGGILFIARRIGKFYIF